MSDVRQQSFVGEVKKCPNCGAEVKSFSAFCSDCGHEFRAKEGTSGVQEFAQKLHELQLAKSENIANNIFLKFSEEDNQSILNFISTFPVPNSREDLLEFLILASSNIDGDAWDDKTDMMKAWLSKFNQAYEKAKIMLANTPEFTRVEELNQKVQKKCKKAKTKETTGIVGGVFLSIISIGLALVVLYLLTNVIDLSTLIK